MTDWSAAGKKAWATRLRNLGAGIAPRARAPMTAADRTAAALKAHHTRRRQFFDQHPLAVLESPAALRQARRILESMREFSFDAGGHWQTTAGAADLEEGWTPRCGGDPIYHTIGQVSGVFASREDVIEAALSLIEQRRPNLPPRMEPLPAAIKSVAEALAENKRTVISDGMRVAIQGPMLPPNWDEVSE